MKAQIKIQTNNKELLDLVGQDFSINDLAEKVGKLFNMEVYGACVYFSPREDSVSLDLEGKLIK